MVSRSLLRASWHAWILNDYRRVDPWWLQIVWTALVCAVIAAGLTVLGFVAFARGDGSSRSLAGYLYGWWYWYQLNLSMALVIGFLIHALFELAGRLLGPVRFNALRGVPRVALHTGLPVLGVLLGWPLGAWLLGERLQRSFTGDWTNFMVGMTLMALLVTTVVYKATESKARQIDAERRVTEGQLQLLQAQIEPHFLFNTLANVLSLIDTEPARARRMLEAFTEYLRSSLGELRRSDVSLAEELALATAYLQVQQMRMDERLRFVIDVDDEARAARLPPLVVQPLVENAVTHGLEAKVEGGTVTLRARRHGQRLVIDVDDDGLGLPAAAPAPDAAPHSAGRGGHGMALRNIRERLWGRFGDDAKLTLTSRAPGTRCHLELPYERAAASPDATVPPDRSPYPH